MTGVLMRRGQRDAVKTPGEVGGRDGRDTSTNPGVPQTANVTSS